MRVILAILALAASSLGAPVRAAAPRPPLVEVVAKGASSDTFVVLYSGDGGWAGGDRALSRALAQRGLPVVGVDSLRYFWRSRSEAGAAADLNSVVQGYARRWGKRHVVLAGYSFGAAALPAIADRLPAPTRTMVTSVVLIAPTDFAYLVLRPGSWLNIRGPHARDIAPALAGLGGLPVVCIWGERDRLAACPRLQAGLVQRRPVAGGHHFQGQYGAVAEIIADTAGSRGALSNL